MSEVCRRGNRPRFSQRATLLKDVLMPVSRDAGRVPVMAWRVRLPAKRIVEFGSSFGISTIYLAAALHDNGGGRVIGSELEVSKVAKANEHLAEAGLADYVEIRAGDARQTLKDTGRRRSTCCFSTAGRNSIWNAASDICSLGRVPWCWPTTTDSVSPSICSYFSSVIPKTVSVSVCLPLGMGIEYSWSKSRQVSLRSCPDNARIQIIEEI